MLVNQYISYVTFFIVRFLKMYQKKVSNYEFEVSDYEFWAITFWYF